MRFRDRQTQVNAVTQVRNVRQLSPGMVQRDYPAETVLTAALTDSHIADCLASLGLTLLARGPVIAPD